MRVVHIISDPYGLFLNNKIILVHKRVEFLMNASHILLDDDLGIISFNLSMTRHWLTVFEEIKNRIFQLPLINCRKQFIWGRKFRRHRNLYKCVIWRLRNYLVIYRRFPLILLQVILAICQEHLLFSTHWKTNIVSTITK